MRRLNSQIMWDAVRTPAKAEAPAPRNHITFGARIGKARRNSSRFMGHPALLVSAELEFSSGNHP